MIALLASGLLAAELNAAVGFGGSTLPDDILPLYGGLVLAGAVVAIWWRALTERRDRRAWLAIGCASLAWTCGEVYVVVAFPNGVHRGFPTPADVGFLLVYPFMYTALWLLARARAQRFQRSLWLDGMIGASCVSAIGVSLVIGFVLARTHGSFSTVATNVVYPLFDVLLLAQVVAVLALSRWHPGRMWWFIGAGLLVFTGADAAYAYTAAIGNVYSVGIAPFWALGLVLIATGAWQHDPPDAPQVRLDGSVALAAPLTFALIAIGLLWWGQSHRLPALGAGLAVLTLLLVIFRTALTFRENLALLDSRRAAVTDDLTGLPNRRRLDERLGELTRETAATTFAGLLLVDLDGFKELNDTLGHHAGDLLLANLGPRFADVDAAELVARLGGDEFAVIVAGEATSVALRAAAERVHAALDVPFEVDDMTVHVCASIGGALYPAHGEDATELMRHADVAMYNAKEARTGYELYRPERDLNSRDRLRLVSDLQRALREEEFVLNYQPKARALTGEITGVEALIRWQHPDEGLLFPDSFLAVAESAGLMRQLTSYVLERALAQLARWNQARPELRIAVNLAMPNLLDLRLPDEVARLISEAGVEPSRLILEITENIVMTDPARIQDVVSRLHAIGVGLSLDDFGVGASSLGYLRRLTVDELKIDKSFVMTMDDDDDSRAIVRATVDLAHNLGLRVVAEGVETSSSWEYLVELNCDEIQGFLLGRPAPGEQIEALLSRNSLDPHPAAAISRQQTLAFTPEDSAQSPTSHGPAPSAAV